jgi:collagen type IV alpha
MAQGFMAWIQPVDSQQGGHPDQGLPGGRPGWGGGEHPSHGLPGFPGAPGHPGHLPARPGRPTDPGYGIEEGGEEAGQLPVWPLDPEHPDVGLPPVAGQPLPPTDPPPGTVWPPLELPGVPEGKAIVLAAIISSTGHKTMRYIVVDVPEGGYPDQGLPGEGEEHPDQGLPSPQPPRPGQRPPQPGQGLPGQRPPARPDQGLPGGRPPQAGQLPGRNPPVRPQPK